MLHRVMGVLLTLCLLFVLVGCGGEAPAEPAAEEEAPAAEEDAASDEGASDEDVDSLVESTIQAVQGVNDYQASMEYAFTEPQEGNLSMDVWIDGSLTLSALGGDPPQFRGEVTSSNLDALPEGTIAVFAPTSAFYNPSQNIVYTADRSQGGGAAQLYRLPLLFMSTMGQALQNLTSPAVNREVGAEETIGDFTTTPIVATPAEGASGGPLSEGETFTVWIDTATNLPVQVLFTSSDGEQRLTINSMEVDAGIDAAMFELEAPEGATVTDISAPTSVASLDEASSEAGFTAPTPGYLPDGLPTEPTAVEVQQTPLGNVIQQTYSTESEETTPDGSPATEAIHISVLQTTDGITDQLPVSPPPGANSSSIDINGQEALLISLGEGQATLSWEQDGQIYTVRGSGFGQDEVTQVAESLGNA